MQSLKLKRPGFLAAALLGFPGLVFSGGGWESQCEKRINDTAKELRECVTEDGLKNIS